MKIGVDNVNCPVKTNKWGKDNVWRNIKEIKSGVSNAWRSVWKRAVELIRTFTTKSDFDTCTLTDTVATAGGDVELGVLEGTTNLLTANQSSAETNLTGFAKNAYPSSETLTRDTTEHWHGSACLKLVVPGTSLSEGLYATCSVTSGQTYTFSVYLKGSGKVWVGLGGKFSVNNNSVNNIELTNEWKRYNVTDTANGSGTANLYIIAEDDNTADTIYIDGLQLEQKDHVCPWVLGGTTSQNMYELTGTIESPAIDLSPAGAAETSEIEFTTTTPTGTTATVQTALSTDGGTTWGGWQAVTNGAAVPGLAAGADVSNARMKWKATLGTNDASVTPKLHDVTVKLNFITANFSTRYNNLTLMDKDGIVLAEKAISGTFPYDCSVNKIYVVRNTNLLTVTANSKTVYNAGTIYDTVPYVKIISVIVNEDGSQDVTFKITDFVSPISFLFDSGIMI